jgi:enolase
MRIKRVAGREIYNSRGWPTLLCEVELDNGALFTGYAPAGSSKSAYEAYEVRDADNRLWGRGMKRAIALVKEQVAPLLLGQEPEIPRLDFALIELDGTADKSHLGSNVLVATSMALYKAHAYYEEVQLYELFAYLIGAETVTIPCPQITIINGTRCGSEHLGIQEFMIAPLGSSSLQHALQECVALYHELHALLCGQGKLVGSGDEGGFIAEFRDDREALDLIVTALERAALADRDACAIAVDVAATHLYDTVQRKYMLHNRALAADELVNFYSELIASYPIYSIEDGMSEDDWQGWRLLTEALGNKIQIVGDALFSTNPERLESALHRNIATAVAIKPNQIGTITEAVQMINLCKKHQLNTIISHRSGETEDSFIADLAVGTSAGQIRAGGCVRSERLSKYNRLLAIEAALIDAQKQR